MGVGPRFIANRGVKQGCVLSPLLFNIFLSDLPSEITNGNCKPVSISNNFQVSSLIWADDVLLLSETENGLDCVRSNFYRNMWNETKWKSTLIKQNA